MTKLIAPRSGTMPGEYGALLAGIRWHFSDLLYISNNFKRYLKKFRAINMLDKLILNSELYKGYYLENDGTSLTGLGKINVFIGQNNTGKSRFLRSLFTDKELEFELKNYDFQTVVTLIRKKKQEVREIFNEISILDADNVFQRIEKVANEIENFKINKVKELLETVKELAEYYLRLHTFSTYSREPNVKVNETPDRVIPILRMIGKEILELINNLFPKDFDFKINKIYIPILRGLRPIQMATDGHFKEQMDNYKSRTIRDYFPKIDLTKNAAEIFTGLSLYDDTKKLLLGDKAGRERIKKFELFLGQTFFKDLEITLIPDIRNDVLLIGIGKEERPVYELGDGIQSNIILLYPLFFNQDKNLMVFIEEPENFMHPGMQRIFLETIMKENFKNFQFFITTHSNHFLDITLDLDNISIYTFNKIENQSGYKYKIENTANDDIKILDLLGTRNASVFLSNCTIWVEGITDRLFLKKYLEVYQKHLVDNNELQYAFREDYSYSFIEYGGGNIVHWSFTNELGWEKIKTSRLSSKIFVIADRDNTEEKPNSEKGNRLQQLKEKLGDKFRIINGREIENTLSEKTLINTIKKLEGKNENIQFTESEIKFEKYKNEKLGAFIENSFPNVKRKYKAKSGTIYCKLDFCKTAVSLINDINDLSSEAVNIAKDIFNFIKNSNDF